MIGFPYSGGSEMALVNPIARRPYFGTAYGISKSGEGLLPWSWASERMSAARNYWIGSTRPDGRPHVAPVWGVWLEDALYFSSDPTSRKARNLTLNPQVVVHLESGDEVVILEGSVEVFHDEELYQRVARAYNAKYQDLIMNEESLGGALVYALHPRNAYGWLERDFVSSATQWQFSG